MLKSIFAAGALLAAATAAARVGMDSEGVRIGGTSVNEATLQLHDTEGGHILASRDVVESLRGVVEITVDGGVVTVDPGVRLARVKDEKGQYKEGYELSSHGRREILISGGSNSLALPTPVTLVAEEGGWKVGTVAHIAGKELRATVVLPLDDTRIAFAPPPGTPPGGGPGEPPPPKKKLDIRRVMNEDPGALSESVDDQTVKRLLHTRPVDVSPSGF